MRVFILWIILALSGLQPAHAADQVLLMAISEYPGNPLDGVKHDVEHALALARQLGYDTRQAVILKDRELTHAGLTQALVGLKQRTRKNDRVFIYYSGHGASLLRGGVCTQTLVPIDATPHGDNLFDLADLNRGLDEIKSLTSDAFVIIDACHSGGLREIASARGGANRVRAKVWTPAQGEICHAPTNAARHWNVASRGTPENNFVFIAAANEREVALDDPDRGGLATSALSACVTHGVADSDASQGISARELAACAQQRINEDVQRMNRHYGGAWKPHRVEVYGNAERNLAVKALPAPGAAPDRAAQTLAAFREIAAGSNGNWNAEVTPSTETARFGEKVAFQYRTAQPGYASVLYVGSDRRDILALLVNKPVTATSGASLGRTAISEPAGDNTFLVLFSQAPLELDAILRDGKAALTAQTLQGLQAATTQTKRNAGKFIADNPDDVAGYAARVVTVRGR